MQNSIWYHKQALIACFAFVLLFGIQGLRAQSYSYTGYDMEGDTIHYVFPPPDSTFVHNRIAMKFMTGALDYSQLCYACDTIIHTKTRSKGAEPQDGSRSGADMDYFSDCMEYLLQQKFGLDVILDPAIRSILAAHGVTYLMRMTAANPCEDTLSISRLGDTVRIDDFNLMIAYFDNDTSVIPTLTDLYLLRSLANNTSVEYAEPDYKYYPFGGTNTPADPFFAGTYPSGTQASLTMIGVNGANGAWEHDVGDSNITVAVVDGGLDYQRCDLGQGLGSGHKVEGGMDWVSLQSANIVNVPGALHGTAVASIIGAFTNWPGSGYPGLPNRGCSDGLLNAIAGIGGGWGPYPDESYERSIGVGLVGYNVSPDGVLWSSIDVARSILDAVNNSAYGLYGKGVDVINLSGGQGVIPHDDSSNSVPSYSIMIRNAVTEAFYNASSFVAGKGDSDGQVQGFPSSHEPASEVIAVGASDTNKARYIGSHWGFNVDLIAPGASDRGPGVTNLALGIRNDPFDMPGDTGATGSRDSGYFVANTSGATPHVSGVVALLRGYLKNWDVMPFAREDIEGMLKAASLDLGDHNEDPFNNPRQDPNSNFYMPGYNLEVGYGFLQADTLFNMLDPTGKHDYQLFHVEIPHDSLKMHGWAMSDTFKSQMFYQPTNDTGKYPGVTNCDVLRREITATFDYSTLGLPIVTNDPLAPVYVWGNTGLADSTPVKRGLASELPNWGEPWCDVTSGVTYGYRGNNNVPGIAGIINNNGTKVTVHTYQYLRYYPGTDSVMDTLPTTANLGLGFTVFAPTKSSSGVKEKENPPETFTVWPTIATTNVMATLNGNETARSLELIDAVGLTISTREFVPELHHLEFSVANLSSGMYFLRVMTADGERDAKIIVRH